MTRVQLEHLIRAAGAIAETSDLIVLGSQAILGQYPDAPDDLTVSLEADVYPRDFTERADLIDGSIGEGSMFHETFGYYAHGVSPDTAKLPEGWQERLVVVLEPVARTKGWCLHPVDLLISKMIAGRPKDRRFVNAAFGSGIVKVETLLPMIADLPRGWQSRIAINWPELVAAG